MFSSGVGVVEARCPIYSSKTRMSMNSCVSCRSVMGQESGIRYLDVQGTVRPQILQRGLEWNDPPAKSILAVIFVLWMSLMVFAQSCSSVPPADPGTSSRVHGTRHHTVRSVRQLRRQRGHITARGVPQRARFRERHLPKGGNIQFSREMSYIFNKTTLGRLQHVWMEHLNISLYTHREGFFLLKT